MVEGFTPAAVIVADLLISAACAGRFPVGYGKERAYREAQALWREWWRANPAALSLAGGETAILSCWQQRLRRDRTGDVRCFPTDFGTRPESEQDDDWQLLIKEVNEVWLPVADGSRMLVAKAQYDGAYPRGKLDDWFDPKHRKAVQDYRDQYGILERAGTKPNALEPFQSDIVDWADEEPEPEPCVIDRYLPEGFVTGFVGDMGTGKSNIELRAGICIAAGKPFFGMPVRQGSVLGIFAEDSKNQLNSRVRAICAEMGIDIIDVAERLRIKSYIGQDVTLWNEKATRTVAAGPTAVARDLEKAIASTPDLRCVILDSDVDIYNGNELDRNARSRYLGWLAGIALKYRIAIIVTFHEAKSSGEKNTYSISGSTAAGYKIKSGWRLEFDKRDPKKRVFTHWKHSFTPKAATLSLEWKDGTWVALGSLDRDEQCKKAALALIGRASDEGLSLSPEKKARTYAARWCHSNQDDGEYTEAEFEKAIDDLAGGFFLDIERYNSKGKARRRYVVSDLFRSEDDQAEDEVSRVSP